MKGFDMWEDFENNSEDEEIQDDDFDFDEMLFDKLQGSSGKLISAKEIVNGIGDLFSEMININKKSKDWYVDYCDKVDEGIESINIEITDLEILDAAQSVVSQGPNGDDYLEYIKQFESYDDDGESLLVFLKLLDMFGYLAMELDLIDNAQDIIDL